MCLVLTHRRVQSAFTGLLKMEKAAKEIKSVTLFLSCWSGLKTSLLLSKGFYSFLCAGHWHIIQINWADAITSGLVGIIYIIRICYITNKSLFSFFKSPHFTKPEKKNFLGFLLCMSCHLYTYIYFKLFVSQLFPLIKTTSDDLPIGKKWHFSMFQESCGLTSMRIVSRFSKGSCICRDHPHCPLGETTQNRKELQVLFLVVFQGCRIKV